MELNQEALSIIETLESAGFEAYAVGGCVRDSLLGLVPKDIDITTSARPEQVKALFPRTFDTGIEHGTVTVLMRNGGYEVTTFRTDGKYTDHRRPDHVEYALSLEDDLSRRDFTINAMAYHPEKGIIDLFGGREDLRRGVIRCVGRAEERFTEDALRMLRAIRFSARLGFVIDEEASQAISHLAPTLTYVSRERVWEELKKTLISPHSDYLERMIGLGLGPYVDPAFAKTELLELKGLPELVEDLNVRAALMLYRFGEAEAGRILRRLKTDNETRHQVCLLIAHIQDKPASSGKEARQLMRQVGREEARRLGELQYGAHLITKEEYTLQSEFLCGEMSAPVSLKELAVTGRDLIEAGGEQGPSLGVHLSWLLDQVIDDPAKNNRETLIALFRQHWYNCNDSLAKAALYDIQ